MKQSAVVLCFPSYHPVRGGMENWMAMLAQRLLPHLRVAVITRRLEPDLPSDEIINGVKVLRYDDTAPALVPARLTTFIRAGHIVRLVRPIARSADKLIFNYFDPYPEQVYAALLLRRGMAARIVCSAGGTMTEHATDRLKRLVIRSATMLIGLSHYALLAMHASSLDAQVCYPIGVMPDNFAHRQACFNSNQILTVCRIHPRKNLEMLIDVASKLPGLRFKVVGSPRYHEKYLDTLRTLAQARGANNVVFAGELDDAELASEFRASVLFFLPSSHEMFGLVFSEAMSYGLPVVAPNHTAIPEAVGEGGVLYEPGNLAQCVDAINAISSSRERWFRLSHLAREFMQQRYEQDYTGRYAALLERLAGE